MLEKSLYRLQYSRNSITTSFYKAYCLKVIIFISLENRQIFFCSWDLYIRFAFARFFLSCVNSSVHQTLEFSHDRLFEIYWFDASIITSRNNFAFLLRLFKTKLFINSIIRFLILEWLFLKYWLNLIQFAFWVLKFSVIELSTVSTFSILIVNLIISWFRSIFAYSFID
jgi:hypothetical protein